MAKGKRGGRTPKICKNCGCKKSMHKWDTGECIGCPKDCKSFVPQKGD